MYKLISIINLGKLWICEIELNIMIVVHYEIEWWRQINKSFTFENADNLSVGAFIICLEIIALGYRWRVVLIVIDNA